MNISIIAGYYANSSDGIGRYTSNLVKNIKKEIGDKSIEVMGVINQTTSVAKKKQLINSFIPQSVNQFLQSLRKELGYYERFKNNNVLLRKSLLESKAQIYHAVSPSETVAAVELNKHPLITTFHDVIPLVSPSRYLLEKYYFNYYCKFAIRSDLIIVDSISTKNDLQSIFGLASNKIIVIYPGIDNNKFYPSQKRDNHSIKTILYLGGLIKRKGIYETLYAFDKLLKDIKDVKLLIAGRGDEFNNLQSEINRLNISKFVTMLDFIDDHKIGQLFHSADIFVYPSQYEGFGLTPLEAMASGVPVITSSTSSLPEVVGDAGITVDPHNINELYFQMKLVLESKKLQDEMRNKGINQAKKFSWEKCAQETLYTYQTLL